MFNQVTIIGTGLLGGSLARDLRKQGLAKRLVGVNRSQKTSKRALADGVIDTMMPAREAVVNAELIVIATPMQAMIPLLQSLQDNIPENAIVTDVGSVKTDLYRQLQQHTPQLLSQFVLAHPIAGGENSGVSASREGLFVNKHVIITDTEEVPSASVGVIRGMWAALGANVISMSLQEHDAIFAKTSHLPHVIAFSLVNFLSHQANPGRLFDLAASGFYDFTRIASSDAEMWRDICITNRDELLEALDGFADQLQIIRDTVATADQNAILSYFGEAKSARDAGLLKKAEAQAKQQ